MSRVAAGDEAALSLLYDRYAAAVMGLAMKILHERNAAEDAVQETFLRVWQRADRFQTSKGAYSSWMFTIAHRLCLDQLRRQKVRPQAAATEGERRQMDLKPSPEKAVPEAAGAAIQRQTMLAALDDLPPEQRQVIRMAYFQGMTRQEIATALDAPLGTVHTRARLGLEKLRRWLQSVEE